MEDNTIWEDLKPLYTFVTIARVMAQKNGIPSQGYPLTTFDYFITGTATEIDPLMLKKIAFRRISQQGIEEDVIDFDVHSLYSFRNFEKWKPLKYDFYKFSDFDKDDDGTEEQ